MNPLLQSALGSILRWALTFLAGWFVQQGIWTQDAANEYIAGAVLAILALGWSLWQKYKSRIHFLAALDARPGTPEDQVKAQGSSRLPVLLLAAALGAGVLAAPACAKGPINQPAIEQATLKALDGVRRAGLVLEQAQLWEIQLHRDGVIRDDVHVRVQAGFARAADGVQVAIAKLPAIASASDQQALIRAVSDAVKDLTITVGKLNDAQAQRLALYIGSAQAIVEMLL